MTWPDAERHARRLLIVPIGSLEQHGPHLPLDCDSRVAVAVANALLQHVHDAAVTPVIPVGVSGEHGDFPGTLSLSAHALATLVIALSRHAAPHWAQMLLVNGHGGNRAALTAAARSCGQEGRRVRVWHAAWPRGDAHAGRTETSLLLHLAPEQVRLDLVAPGNAAPLADLMPTLRAVGVRAVSPNGVLGDPRGASAAEGRIVLDALIQGALAAATHEA